MVISSYIYERFPDQNEGFLSKKRAKNVKEPALCFIARNMELGEMLLPAFSTSSGIATGQIDLHSGHTTNGWTGHSAILSELGSLQLEFRSLAKFSGINKYEEMSMRGMQFLYKRYPKNGLLGVKIDIASGRVTDSTITLGALGDSFYEYLLNL